MSRRSIAPRSPISPIGVYFSPATRNLFANDFISSYRGILILLLRKHMEFQIVTPRTLADFHGPTLVLPDVRILGDAERTLLTNYAHSGGRLILTGDSALPSAEGVFKFPTSPGRAYYAALQKNMDPQETPGQQEFLDSLKSASPVHLSASPMIASSMARVDGKLHVFLLNLAALQSGVNPVQPPRTDVQITISGAKGGSAFYLPFLGEIQPLSGAESTAGMTYRLPSMEEGGVFWVQP